VDRGVKPGDVAGLLMLLALGIFLVVMLLLPYVAADGQ
jgi:hypothetical protein